jgi:hypothetical protein
MPAYARVLDRPTCGHGGCPRFADKDVRNWRNEHVGYRCTKHAPILVKLLNNQDTRPA